MDKKSHQSYTILVIDDDERVRTLIRDILLFGGHRVIEASDGSSGMKRLEEGGLDMVFTDLGMPGMNGWEVVKRIKSKTPHLPVALITGWGTELDDETIEKSGVDLIIGKPFQVHEVLEAVGRLKGPS
jgi:CheY-like chemotaxis protein